PEKKPEKPPEKPEKPTEKKPEKPEKPTEKKPEKPPEKPEKPTEKKPEKPEKPEKPADKKPEKPEKPEKKEDPLDFSKAINKLQKSTPAPKSEETPLDFSKAINKHQKAASEAKAVGTDNAPASSNDPPVSAFAISRWQHGVTNKVRDNWRKPSGLRGEAALEVIVVVQVGPDGSLVNPRVSHPSGNAIYDESVMRAISRTVSVDPPPQGCQECRELEIRFRPEVE
ncbi:MAG: TonB C-terminal domain-containing protein, partial [Magnetococcales bacterium]|nr:TonB C-terminal domain-containing protein [Magnetococcales bacterium]